MKTGVDSRVVGPTVEQAGIEDSAILLSISPMVAKNTAVLLKGALVVNYVTVGSGYLTGAASASPLEVQ
jgi:glycosylphosphatidylinositol transamidase (GPIT) subunit GPI8